MDYLIEISKLSCELPVPVLEDVNKRITDWIASGGKEDDSYIKRQYEYCIRVLGR